MILAILALAAVSIQPAAPKVGDLITVRFDGPVKVQPSRDYEIVSQKRNVVVVRTFAPKPFVLLFANSTTNVRVPVQSVLKPKDNLVPAPLAPPRPVPYPRAPFIALAIAALCAVAAWLALWLRARKPAEIVIPQLSADERFRRAVLALRTSPHARRWAVLADETRAYLAATRAQLGPELTTTEVLPRLADQERVVEEILRQGDLEKFSPRREATGDFEGVIANALLWASSRQLTGDGGREGSAPASQSTPPAARPPLANEPRPPSPVNHSGGAS
jgi:hypothetical protein